MRAHLIDELGSVDKPRFLVYLMGPYTTFDVDALLSPGTDPEEVTHPDARADPDAVDEMMATLRRTQGRLRVDPGVNAFLAVDAGIPMDEVDPATQSIEFARASNAVVFVVPRLGSNFGVGMEVGSVLEALEGTERERVLFVHETDVSSAMIRGIGQRWDVPVVVYGDQGDLVREVRTFVREIMERELVGDLPRLD